MTDLNSKDIEVGTFNTNDGLPSMGLKIHTAYPVDLMEQILYSDKLRKNLDIMIKTAETDLENPAVFVGDKWGVRKPIYEGVLVILKQLREKSQ